MDLLSYCVAFPLWLTYPAGSSKNNLKPKEGIMKNPLDSLWGTVISGLILTLILFNIVKYALG
jgi:hypothetical protein